MDLIPCIDTCVRVLETEVFGDIEKGENYITLTNSVRPGEVHNNFSVEQRGRQCTTQRPSFKTKCKSGSRSTTGFTFRPPRYKLARATRREQLHTHMTRLSTATTVSP